MTGAFALLSFDRPLAALITPGLMWLGLGLASVPIIIHLLNRRRVRPVRWAAMSWLAAALKRHQRRLKVENWLLLLLRMAAIVLLGLALARPILENSRLAGALGGKRSVYLVLDNSYSTDAKVDSRSVFELVRHQAGQILDSLGPDDAVAVVLTNDPAEGSTSGNLPYVLQPRTVGGEGATRAKEALASGVRPRHAPAMWTDTLRKVEEQMAPEDVGRQVYIVTDFQARDWSVGEGDSRLRDVLEGLLRAPAAVRIVDVGGQDRRNLAVADIENLTDPAPFVGRPAQLAVTVANHGPTAIRGAKLDVAVGETGFRRTLIVPEIAAAQTDTRVPVSGTAIVRVDLPPHAFDRPGVHMVRCRILVPSADPGADSLERDSTRWFALHVRPQIRVVGWVETSANEDVDAAEDYLRGVYEGVMPDANDKATASEDGMPWFFRYETVRYEGQLSSQLRERVERPIDLVVLANTAPRDPALIAHLSSFVSEGGGLLVFVGDKVGDADALNALLFTQDGPSLLPRRFGPREVRIRNNEGVAPFVFDMRTRKNAHPVAEPFTNEAAQDWMARFPPKVWGRLPFLPPDAEDGDEEPPEDDAMVLQYRDGKSAIVAGEYGIGRTLWVGTSVDNGWIAEAGWAFTPVLLHESALWLTEPRSGDQNLLIGGSVRVRAPVGARTVRLTVPGGNQVTPNPVGDAGEGAVTLEYRYDDVGTAGPWRFSYERIRADGERETVARLLAVNVDPSEGALHPARAQDVGGSSLDGLDLTFATSFETKDEQIDEANQGELTRWILWAVLALLLIESILALRFGRRSVAPDEPIEGAV